MAKNGAYSKEMSDKTEISSWENKTAGSSASRRSKKTKAKQAYGSR
jgi:hypothetical protein